MFRYLINYFIPGLLLIVFAFIFGSQKNPLFGLFAFLPFFTLGIILIIEGKKKVKNEKKK